MLQGLISGFKIIKLTDAKYGMMASIIYISKLDCNNHLTIYKYMQNIMYTANIIQHG